MLMGYIFAFLTIRTNIVVSVSECLQLLSTSTSPGVKCQAYVKHNWFNSTGTMLVQFSYDGCDRYMELPF